MKNCLNHKFILFFCLFLLVRIAFSQDVHFSQYYASPLTLNPSSTGDFDGDWRFSSNYRNQWRSIAEPFNTMSVGYERQIYIHSQKFSGGIFFINDESGGINLNVNKLYISLAYHREVNYNEFSVGFQLGWVFKSVDESKMTLPNQYNINQGLFDSKLPSGELSTFEPINYPDVNLGIAWQREMYNLRPFAGLSLHHIIFPKESFTEYDNYLYLRLGFQAGLRYDMNNYIYLVPYLNVNYHRRAKEILAGFNTGYKLQKRPLHIKDLFVGFHLRNNIDLETDAVILVAGINFENIYVGVSYDINISGLSSVTANQGALEFAIIYTGLTTNMVKTTIPCELY